MRTHSGNVGAVIADIGAITINSLAQYGIPYDELIFGKPWADVYVDDLAVNANLDTYRELGWVAEDDHGPTSNHMAEVKKAKQCGMVASRAFNHVQVLGDKIVKSSRSQQILGELYFYCHIPEAVAHLFPKIHAVEFIDETSTYSITMQKLSGSSYSQLLVGRSLTKGRLRAMLSAVRHIHNASDLSICQISIPPKLETLFQERHVEDMTKTDIYANYSRKLKSRYNQYIMDYESLDSSTVSKLVTTLTSRLEAYERDGRGIFASVIHGDPVLSNAILNDISRQVHLFDVRCQQGEALTLAGDVLYDLAKILQSLNGYDHIIMAENECFDEGSAEAVMSRIVPLEDRILLMKLQEEVFWPFVKESYGGKVKRQDLLDITSSLLFTLIPLHGESRRAIFLKMAQNMIEHSLACPLEL